MSYVVLDLETSGLDARSDAIIEIALIRYTDLGVEEERYTSLVHPGFLISQEITHITSITPNDLIDAPVFSEIREKIIEFIDDDTIVGHNIDFDIGFLVEYAVISRDHSRIDTFRLAEIVAIDAKSLNLSSLLEYFGEPHVDAHRALADTEATGRLFQRLLERLLSLPTECRALFLSVVGRTGMDHEFRLVLDYIHLTEDSSTTPWRESLLARSRPSRIIDRPSGEIPTFTEVLDRATHLEERPEQKKMLQIVSDTLSQRSQSCIEAPTGVGKTIAYFLPSVLHALSTGTQVCISTHTRTLQDQIEYKDIPKIRSLLEPF